VIDEGRSGAMETQGLLETRELDARGADGIEVRLLWQPAGNRVCLQVTDSRTDDEFIVAVATADAMDAFRHPFAYINTSAPGRAQVLAGDSLGEEVTT
jgi:hypothetical protein